MRKNRILFALASLYCLAVLTSFARSATITACTFDKESYYPGQTGQVAVTVYNDMENTIRIVELTATIDYYYNDDIVYLQTFFVYPDPPTEIQQGQSDTLHIQFSLPVNIAPGYTTLLVRAKTEIWNAGVERWQGFEHPTYEPILYVESPFKPQFEEQQTANEQLQTQLQEQQTVNRYNTTMIYILAATTILFGAIAGFLLLFLRRARMMTQPVA